MALQHLRSSTANKRPTPAVMATGQLAMNTETNSPGLFFKNSGGTLVKIGPVHVGATAPNATPGAGGEAGNSIGEQWLDNSSSRYVFKIWDGSAWRSEDGEFVNASGDTMTGALVMDNQQQVRFRETTVNGINYIALQAPASVASDKTITLPDVTGTVVTTGDTGTVTSTMLLDGTILNADVNASAAIAGTKISPDFGSQNTTTTGTSTAASFNPTSATVPTDGLYKPGTNQLAIATTGNTRLFVGNTGLVGIGTTSPNTVLNVRKDSTISTPAGSASIVLSNRDSSLASGNMAGGIFADMYRDIANPAYAAGIWFNRQQEFGGLDSGGEIVFGANSQASTSSAPAERARIDSSGRLLVGTSSVLSGSTAVLQVNSSGNTAFFSGSNAAADVLALHNSATINNNVFVNFGTEAAFTSRGTISFNRTGGLVSYNTTSDYRCKTIIGVLNNSGTTIDALKVYVGLMKDATVQRPMLVAHEAQEVAPYCVTGEKDAVDGKGNPVYQQMDHQVLVPLLIAEIQSLRQRVAALEAH